MSGKHGQGQGPGSGGQTPGGKRRQGAGAWLTPPRNQVEAELDQALDQAATADTDEVALRRVWSRLSQLPELVPTHVEAPAPRRTRWSWVVGASLAGAAAAVAMMLVGTPGRVRTALGPSPASTAPAGVHVDDGANGNGDRSVLVAPATVRTAKGEVLHLALKGGTEVTVTQDSTLVLDQDERPAVTAGEVQFHVPHQAPGHTFTVRANDYRVVVVGTRFNVSVDQRRTGVSVDEGVVEIWNDSTRLARLSRGESWASTPAATEAAVAVPKTPVLTGRDAAPLRAPAVTVRRTPGQRPQRGTRVMRASLDATVSNASGGESALLGSSDKTLPLVATPERAAAPAVAETPASAPAVAPVAPAAAPANETAALIAQARAARTTGDARRALNLYRTLAQRGGTAGENAEYEIGKVLRDGLHQPREAISAWRSYRAQHPRGLLRAEADISVVETLVAVDEKSEALGEAMDFVRRFPDSERRVEMGGLAGDLLRERGEFRGALAEYDGALEVGRGRRDLTDAISYHRAVCILHEDRELGTTALRSYLQNFSSGRFRAQAERLLNEQSPLQARRP